MKILKIIDNYVQKFSGFIPSWTIPLLARFIIFWVFWLSVQTKISGWTIAGQHFAFWNLQEVTIWLFEDDFATILLKGAPAAYLATFGEFFLSLAILFGVFTRLSAFGLLLMTVVIQIVLPDAWFTHLTWAALLIFLMKYGAGAISVDNRLGMK